MLLLAFFSIASKLKSISFVWEETQPDRNQSQIPFIRVEL